MSMILEGGISSVTPKNFGQMSLFDDAEARSLMDKSSAYEQKFHDMTDEEFSIHRTRWNIMSIVLLMQRDLSCKCCYLARI